MSWTKRWIGLKPALLMVGFSFWVMPIAIAQASERYPTEQELRQLRSELPRWVQEWRSGEMSYLMDENRTSQERQRRQAFVNAWTRTNSAIAPFLGSWGGYEQTLSIYPSRNRNQVCVIESGEGEANFATGVLRPNGEIQMSDRRFILRSGNYLGIAGVYNGQPFVGGEIPLNNPRPLIDPSRFNLSRGDRLQFSRVGCTTSRP